MVEHPDIVAVGQRHVDRDSRRRDLDVRGNDRLAAADRLAHRLAHARMQNGGGMLDVAVEPDNGGLAVAHRRVRQHRQRLANQEFAQLGAERYEFAQIIARHAGERVFDHCAGGDAGDRASGRQSALAVDGVADDQQPANVHCYLPIRR
jgi:hypothetical protein